MKSKTTFFTRKNILLILACSGIVYLVIIGAFIAQRQIDHHRRVAALKAQIAKNNRLSPAEKSIKKGELYEIHMITSVQPFQRLLFDYIQRTYKLSPELGVARTPMTVPSGGPLYPSELNYIARIAYPENVIKVPPKDKPDGITFTNIYSANCDIFPLPPNFWQEMEHSYNEGGYYLTHAALALVFMKDNGCTIPASASELSGKLTEGMGAIVNDPKSRADLRYEAVAFLLLTGHRDQVKSAWIDQIISEQKPDGSWKATIGGKSSDEHATLLAMWSLLEYSRPEVKYQPLIRHESG